MNNSSDIYHQFLYPQQNLFEKSFPGNHLQFIPYPSKNNFRMLRQQGVLLYDTVDYSSLKVKNLEEFISNYDEPGTSQSDGTIIPSEPTLYKVLIDKEEIEIILSLLELMGITGGTLYANAEGVAMDVINSYYYNIKTGYLRDVRFLDP